MNLRRIGSTFSLIIELQSELDSLSDEELVELRKRVEETIETTHTQEYKKYWIAMGILLNQEGLRS